MFYPLGVKTGGSVPLQPLANFLNAIFKIFLMYFFFKLTELIKKENGKIVIKESEIIDSWNKKGHLMISNIVAILIFIIYLFL